MSKSAGWATALVAAVIATGCAPERGPGRIDDAEEIELCVGEVDVPDPALREFLLGVLPQPEPEMDTDGEPVEPEPVILAEELRKLKGINAPNLGIVDLTGLECAQSVISLGLAENEIADIGPLVHLTGLKQLELSGNNVTNLSVLSRLYRLERVALDDNAVTKIGPLARLSNLQSLDLSANGLKDLSPLAGLTGLTVLALGHNEIDNVAPLAGLTELFGLELNDNAIKSIEDLSALTNLAFIDLEGNEIESIEPLSKATKMREIEVSRNLLTSLSGIENMTQLTKLVVQENDVTSTQGVANLTLLSVLDLGDNEVTELPGVANLRDLRRLVLAVNHVSDISAVTGLAELRDLDVRFNDGLVDLSPVGTLPLLGFLGAGGTGIMQDLTPLAGREVLRSINYTNAIAGDLSFFGQLPALESVNFNVTPLSVEQLGDIAQATTLQTLVMQQTGITDLAPLAPLPLIEQLDAQQCDLQTLESAAAWPNLRELKVQDNPNLTSLAGLETHELLLLVNASRTSVADLTPLAANETFRQGDTVIVEDTPLDADDCPAIQTLQSRSAVVESDISCG